MGPNTPASKEDVAEADAWRQPVEELWDAVGRLRGQFDADRRRADRAPVTNKEIAETIGVSDRTLGDWLRKRTTVPDWYELRKLVEHLGGSQEEWHHRWERAKAAYDTRPRTRAVRSANGAVPVPEGQPTALDEMPPPSLEPQLFQPQTLEPKEPEPHPADASRRRWVGSRNAMVIGVVAMVVIGVTVGLSITAWARHGQPSEKPSPSTWRGQVVNTYSAKYKQDVGVIPSKSPLRSEPLLPGFFTGSWVEVVCQYSKGRSITDRSSGRSSSRWYRLVSGAWISELYVNVTAHVPGCATAS